MNPADVALVQSSFEKVKPIAADAASLFYARLFALDPDLRPMFKGDIDAQGRKLMATLGVVIGGLSDLPSVLPAASTLARRHVDYGVAASHYAVVGEALLWTLEHGLGDGRTPAVSTAWSRAYATLSSFMIGEAYGRPAAPG